jgi:hypothetical protein
VVDQLLENLDHPLGEDAVDGAVLELAAVYRVRKWFPVAADPRHRKPESMPLFGSSSSSGGRPRPSRKWHDEHDWALKTGPSPSRPSVDAGAVTQLSLKKLFPTANARRSSGDSVGRASPNALEEASNTVASPPERASIGSVVVVVGTVPAGWSVVQAASNASTQSSAQRRNRIRFPG